jgi:hypothetical protein
VCSSLSPNSSALYFPCRLILLWFCDRHRFSRGDRFCFVLYWSLVPHLFSLLTRLILPPVGFGSRFFLASPPPGARSSCRIRFHSVFSLGPSGFCSAGREFHPRYGVLDMGSRIRLVCPGAFSFIVARSFCSLGSRLSYLRC